MPLDVKPAEPDPAATVSGCRKRGAGALPFVSVVVTTRDRPALLVGALDSILRCDYPRFEVLVVDQSTDAQSEWQLQALIEDGCLRYFRMRPFGLSQGRNNGVERACPSPMATVTQPTRSM